MNNLHFKIPDCNKRQESKKILEPQIIDDVLLSYILQIPNFLNIDTKGKGFEVKPGRFAPIYINVKTTWDYPHIFFNLCDRLKSHCLMADSIIGIETGGSPFASVIAKDLLIPLTLSRKRKKMNFGIFTSDLNGKKNCLIVDDVIATGKSIEKTITKLKKTGRHIKLLSVLSFGMDKEIEKKYGVKMTSLYKIKDVYPFFPKEHSKLLISKIEEFKKNLKERIYG